MTTELTPIRGLIKPVPGTGETVRISDLNSNFDKLDAGAILVENGTTPSNDQLYEGAIVKERTSGIVWVAQRNGLGGYNKSHIRYPYQFSAWTPGNIVTMTGGYQTWGCANFRADVSVNASSGEISHPDNGWICPRTGIYTLHHRYVWGNNGSGGRRESIGLIGGSGQFNELETNVMVNPLGITTNDIVSTKRIAAGDFYVWQFRAVDNLAPASLTAFLDITLVNLTA